MAKKMQFLLGILILSSILLVAYTSVVQPRLVPVKEIKNLIEETWYGDIYMSQVMTEIPMFKGENIIDVLTSYKAQSGQFAISDGGNVVAFVKSGYTYFLNHMIGGGKNVPAGIHLFIPGPKRADLFQSAFLRSGIIVFEGGTEKYNGTPWIKISVSGGSTLVEGSSADNGYNWTFKVLETGKTYSNLSDAMRAALKGQDIKFPSWIW